MKTQSTFRDFDFENTWEMQENKFPVLKGSNHVYLTEINVDNMNVEVGEEKTIELSFTPEIVDDAVFKYSIDDEEIATVSNEGIVYGLKEGSTIINIETLDENISKTINLKVTKEKTLTGILVTTAPSNTSYIEGQNFDSSGMKVTATYNDGTSKEITDYTITDGNNLTLGKTSVIISYTENGITKTATQAIRVVAKTLTGIKVTTAPSDTSYIEGQNFDSAGMKVTATYDNGDTKEITNYTITNGNNLELGTTSVIISYTENGVTKTTTQLINVVAKKLTGIAVTTAPSNTSYIEGQNFDASGMKVTATYDNGTSKEITDYTIKDGNNLSLGKTSVTISYTENGITKTTTQNITVTEKVIAKGDINQDGQINTLDMVKILRYIAASKNQSTQDKYPTWNLEGESLIAADINGDGKVNTMDLLKILRHISATKDNATAEAHPDWIIK